MSILYISSLAFGFVSICIAIAMINVKSALDTWWQLASIFSDGMLGLFLLGFISKRVGAKAAKIGVCFGVALIAWMSISPIYFPKLGLEDFMSPFHKNMAIVFGTSIIFVVGFLFAYLLRQKKKR